MSGKLSLTLVIAALALLIATPAYALPGSGTAYRFPRTNLVKRVLETPTGRYLAEVARHQFGRRFPAVMRATTRPEPGTTRSTTSCWQPSGRYPTSCRSCYPTASSDSRCW